VQAAKAMAATAIRLLEDKALLAAARQDFEDARGEQGYVCPIPAQVQPLMPA
jgi:aminobenzoyl-glutamate utilization protein B